MDSIEYLPVIPELLRRGVVKELTHQPPSLTVAIGLVLFLASLFLSWSKTVDDGAFKNDKGEKIKEIKKDTRFLKLTNGAQVSQEGKDLASDDAYIVRCGPFRELVISTPEQMQEFLRKDYKDHKKAHNLNLGDYVGRLYGHCLGEQNGQQWKTMRSHFDPDFSHQAAAGMIPLFSTEIARWIDELSAKAANANGGFVEDVVKASKLLSFRLISLTVYGDAFDETIFAKLLRLYQLYEKLLMTALTQPQTSSKWYNMLPTSAKRQMDAFQREWKAFNLDVVHSARERNLSCPAERIYRGVDQAHEMNDIEFLQTFTEILFANVDITGLVLASLLANLAGDATFQSKLRAEVAMQKTTTKKNDGASANIADYAAKQDSLLHYLTLESIRLVSHVHFSPPELTGAPKRLSGYAIPAGTPVVVDVHRLNTHPSVWGADAQRFRPERFADMTPTQWRYGLMRFGIASGRCLGKNMADLILKMVAAGAVEAFELVKVEATSPGEGKGTEMRGLVGEVEFRKR